MSMCFLFNGILYADRFQIRDYENYMPTLIDNKIFVSSDKKVIMAVMGLVPADMDDVMERMEKILYTFSIDVKKSSKDGGMAAAIETLKNSIKSLKLTFMVVFKTTKQTMFTVLSNTIDGETQIQTYGDGKNVRFLGPSGTIAFLEYGLTPAAVFKGVKDFKGTVSAEHTAYDIKKNKFIPT